MPIITGNYIFPGMKEKKVPPGRVSPVSEVRSLEPTRENQEGGSTGRKHPVGSPCKGPRAQGPLPSEARMWVGQPGV